MTWFSVTPFIILAIVLLPVIGYLLYARIKDMRVVKTEVHSKIDLILEETLKHDALFRVSDTANKQILVGIDENTKGISEKLMNVVGKLINGKKHD